VFGNYRAEEPFHAGSGAASSEPGGVSSAAAQPQARDQAAIDRAVARSFLHRFLAKAYEDSTLENWQWLCDTVAQGSLRAATQAVAAPGQNASGSADELTGALERLSAALTGGPINHQQSTINQPAQQSFLNACLAAFGHAARGSCPLNEIEYGDIKADPLFQPHRLADLAAFYRAFGLQVAEDAGERHDHICLELEFMCVLAAKEAYALEHQLGAGPLAQCHDAQKKFLREHLGRWVPAFSRRLAAATGERTLLALAEFTRVFVEGECARFGVNAGSEDLALRPVDDATESMCGSCGINNLPPGAVPAEVAG
jgi:DMSO reductase family type II enzyme chaperone